MLGKIALLFAPMDVSRGQILAKKGDVSDAMYIVVSGQLRVHDGEQAISYLSEREVLGEMAVFESELHVSTITAVDDCQLLRLDQPDFMGFLDEHPEVSRGILGSLNKQLHARARELKDIRYHLEQIILPLGVALAEEDNLERLLERIVVEAQSFCNADAETMYLRADENRLRFFIMRTNSLGVALGGSTGKEIPFAPLSMYDDNSGKSNDQNVATYVALSGQSTNIPNIYATEEFDFSATREFDKNNNYRSVSSITVPLKNPQGDVIGVMQLFNAMDPDNGHVIPFDPTQQMVVESLASQAAVALNIQKLLDRQKGLLKLESDLHTARQIQADFLPEELPQTAGYEIAAWFEPAQNVAGDFYDTFMVSNNRRVLFIVADVVDKGVPAALFMALVRSLTRAFAQQHYSINWTDMLEDNDSKSRSRGQGRRRRGNLSTGTIALKNAITLTNKYILDNHIDLNMFAGMLNPRNGRIDYINAGHNPPFIVDAQGRLKTMLMPSGPAVGDDERIRFCY